MRVGVVGTGSFGRNHVRILSDLPTARLVGLYDRDQGVAERVAVEYGSRAFASLEELADACEALILAVPTAAHAEGVRAFVEGREPRW